MADWLDLLAENPTLINASLNSTGPFRWFLFDALRDEKGLDRMVTELMMMRGDVGRGGMQVLRWREKMTPPLPQRGTSLPPRFWASNCSAHAAMIRLTTAPRNAIYIRWRRCSRARR